MKILIVVGFVVPQATKFTGEQKIVRGGWVTGLIKDIKIIPELEIAVAMKSGTKSYEKYIDIDGLTFFFLPSSKKNSLDVNDFDVTAVLTDFSPDVIHAEGAEHFITNNFFSNFNGKKILSIKGIFNDIQRHEFGGMNIYRKMRGIKDFIFMCSLVYQRYFRYSKRKLMEKESYELADYILGRTEYDFSYGKYFNSACRYYHLNESLREPFYTMKWNIKGIKPHSIFVGNGLLARKGFHIVLEAVNILKKSFPNINVSILMNKELSTLDSFKYKGFICREIVRLNLNHQINFLGELEGKDLSSAMVFHHLHVLPSFIENSSNILGESMLLGVPSICSFVGGLPSLAHDEREVLFYPPLDAVILANKIRRIFESDPLAIELSENSRKRAVKQYSRQLNKINILDIYKNILEDQVKDLNHSNYR